MKLLEHFKDLTLHPKNAEELKGLILQLALHGKLTPDFRVSETQVKENVVEGTYSLPKHWYWDKFDNVADFKMGKTPPSKEMEYWGGEIPWISIADMETYQAITTTKKTITELGLKNYFKNEKVKKGTLIMSFKLTIGKTSILGNDACHNEAIISVYPKEAILKEYLFLFLPIISNWGTQVSALMGNTLNKGKIQNMKVPIPPLEEQKAIVEVVNQLFVEVEQLEALTKDRLQLKEDFVTSALQQLSTGDATKEWSFLAEHFTQFFTEKSSVKKLRESILQLAVQGKLTHHWRIQNPTTEDASTLLERIKEEKAELVKAKKIKKEKLLPEIEEDEIPYELPEGWVWCRLNDLGSITGGGTPSKGKAIYWGGDIPWVSPKDMKSEYIIDSQDKVTMEGVNNSSANLIPKGSLLIVGRSGILARTVPVSINDVECTVNQDLKVVVPFITTMNKFIKLGLKGMESRLLKDFVKYGMTVHSLKYSEFAIMTYPLPPLEEQKAIVEKVNALMGLCDSLEQEIEHSTTQVELLMKSCLKEVFEG